MASIGVSALSFDEAAKCWTLDFQMKTSDFSSTHCQRSHWCLVLGHFLETEDSQESDGQDLDNSSCKLYHPKLSGTILMKRRRYKSTQDKTNKKKPRKIVNEKKKKKCF